MTISMDHRSHRKNSWDSKMSISTTNSEPRRCRRGTPSSIISSDSDIRFTRKKLSSQTRCGCCIVAILLLLLLLAAATVYVGYTYLLPETPTEQIFRGTFRVVNGDSFSPELADPNNNKFKERARDYRERINLLFRKSSLNYLFVGSEILALDGTEDKDLIVHFNILMDPYETVDAKELENAIASEIAAEQSLYFKNLTIDATSLEIKPGHMLPQPSTTTLATTVVSEAVTQTPAPPRRCYPLQLEYCKRLMYNVTTYPNVLEHRSLSDVNQDMITFRELVDAECYKYAYEFVCQLLQPGCLRGEDEDGIIKPCRSFCRDFMAGCGSRLSGKFKEMLDCSRFPEYEGEMSCFTKPNCAAELQQRALSPRLCDGVADCEDLSDEKSCAYCPAGQMYCGIGRTCIPNESRCDGKHDCPDGADERACLTLVPDVESLKKPSKLTPHQRKYYSEGFVAFNERGQVGKLCTENLNRSLSVNQSTAVLQTVASSLCKTLTYQNFLSATVEKDSEPNVPYVKMKNPTASEISFVRTKCRSHQVLKVKCSTLECGLQITHGPEGLQALNKMSAHGDWPWHAALFKEDVHICDGTLLSPDWVATTISCFQGQPKAEWTARFGSVRLMSTSPWDQERTIVGMIKSPVEGSTIALVRLDQPVVLNDFVRPICLPKENTIISSQTDCNTLGWARNREQLQRVQIKQISMEKCENISISSVNGLCTETIHGQNDCNEEEFAGSPMMCQNEDNENWMLVGVSNWRIACSKSGMERPRMYDKISSNINWIQEAINSNET